jgi:hypothetical protein
MILQYQVTVDAVTRVVKGAKYSQVMHGDAKSIRLNKLAQLIMFLTHCGGTRTQNILTQSFMIFLNAFDKSRITPLQSHGRFLPYPFQFFIHFHPNIGRYIVRA